MKENDQGMVTLKDMRSMTAGQLYDVVKTEFLNLLQSKGFNLSTIPGILAARDWMDETATLTDLFSAGDKEERFSRAEYGMMKLVQHLGAIVLAEMTAEHLVFYVNSTTYDADDLGMFPLEVRTGDGQAATMVLVGVDGVVGATKDEVSDESCLLKWAGLSYVDLSGDGDSTIEGLIPREPGDMLSVNGGQYILHRDGKQYLLPNELHWQLCDVDDDEDDEDDEDDDCGDCENCDFRDVCDDYCDEVDDSAIEEINRELNEKPEGYPDLTALIEETKDGGAPWSEWLERNYSSVCALSFAIGSNLLNEIIKCAEEDLKDAPEGTTLEGVGSDLEQYLPWMYGHRYDLDFVKKLRAVLTELRKRAVDGKAMHAYSPAEEILMRACMLETMRYFRDDLDEEERELVWRDIYDLNATELLSDWAYLLSGDSYVQLVLFDYDGEEFPDMLKDEYGIGDEYDFENWFEPQFDFDED